MPADLDADLAQRLRETVLARVDTDAARRHEALCEFFSVTAPQLSRQAASELAAAVPPVLPGLYERWTDMFVERLFETVKPEDLAELGAGTPRAAATLHLVFIMFMESERMQQQVAEDVRAAGLAAPCSDEDLGALSRILAPGSGNGQSS